MFHFHRSPYARYALILLGGVALMLALLGGLPSASAQTDQRCFPETGQCISGEIRVFWEQNGGLPVFGFPITAQGPETTSSGTFVSQWFERTRLELHPENAPPYNVLLGRAGAIRLQQEGLDWYTFPKANPAIASNPGCVYAAQTGHSVCGDFLTAYRSFGLNFPGVSGISPEESLALFGLPLSEPQNEVLEDGRTYVVQWFERVRFELHPENAPPYNVLFGRLGALILYTYLNPAVPPTPAPPTPTPGNGPGGCVLGMTFDRDITVPDGSTLQPNAQFIRTWRVINSGTCYWDSRYRLVFANGDQMSGPAEVSVPNAEPGARVDISVPLIAPAVPGHYRGHWVMRAGNGQTFGGLIVDINVAAAPVNTPTPTSAPAPVNTPTSTSAPAPVNTPTSTSAPAPTQAPIAPIPTATTAPAPALVGPVWAWQGTTLSDGTRVTVADPSRYTLQLLPDGTVAIKADCNRVGGTYTQNGNSLTITLGPSTLAACPPDSQADVYLQQLQAVDGYLFDQGALVLELKLDSGGMRFNVQ